MVEGISVDRVRGSSLPEGVRKYSFFLSFSVRGVWWDLAWYSGCLAMAHKILVAEDEPRLLDDNRITFDSKSYLGASVLENGERVVVPSEIATDFINDPNMSFEE